MGESVKAKDLPQQTEKQFQRAVMDFARLHGWAVYHTYDSRRSSPGFPDLVMARYGRVIFAELKTEKGRMSGPQMEWMTILGTAAGSNLEAALWRPSDWPWIEQRLK